MNEYYTVRKYSVSVIYSVFFFFTQVLQYVILQCYVVRQCCVPVPPGGHRPDVGRVNEAERGWRMMQGCPVLLALSLAKTTRAVYLATCTSACIFMTYLRYFPRREIRDLPAWKVASTHISVTAALTCPSKRQPQRLLAASFSGALRNCRVVHDSCS